MEQRSFTPEKLILVNVNELVDHEKWVPGIYAMQLDAQRHFIEIMENGERVTRICNTIDIKHADEAIDFKIRYEVYAEYYGSNCEYHEGVNAKEAAYKDAQEWSSQENCKRVQIIVDRVLIGGTHEAHYIDGKIVDWLKEVQHA